MSKICGQNSLSQIDRLLPIRLGVFCFFFKSVTHRFEHIHVHTDLGFRKASVHSSPHRLGVQEGFSTFISTQIWGLGRLEYSHLGVKAGLSTFI